MAGSRPTPREAYALRWLRKVDADSDARTPRIQPTALISRCSAHALSARPPSLKHHAHIAFDIEMRKQPS